MWNPLEQFGILPLIPLQLGHLYLSFTNSSLFCLLLVGIILFSLHCITPAYLVPNAWQSLWEMIYEFVLKLVKEQIQDPQSSAMQTSTADLHNGIASKSGAESFFPLMFVVFTFVLMANLLGMIPYSFTVTSHFIVTLGLSFSLFVGVTLVGFQRHGIHYLSLLLPQGVPLILAPFLVLLELISYCFRALSLGIRLFANMMAGHSLVKILGGFAWTMLSVGGIFYLVQLAPLGIVFALIGLECGVAMLQAYVLTILLCIYINDAVNLH